MKKFRQISLILIICFVMAAAAPSAGAISTPNLSAGAVVLADLRSGTILYEKNMADQRSPASLTKIMTGLLAVEAVERGDVNLGDIITAGADCWTGLDTDSSNAEIQVGEQMTFEDYLYCAMVKSANEACNVIATAVDGSIQAFVNRMNSRAAELGATHTYFSDPNGLSDANHYTTAYDLYLITREAMSHQLFVKVVNTASYEIAPTNTHGSARVLKNSNALLCQDGTYGDGYLYAGASGVKTGYTRQAGYCLVSTATRNNMSLMAIVLGCGGWLNTGEADYGNFTNTIKLYDWAFGNFEYKTLITAGEAMKTVPIEFAKDNVSAILRPLETVTLLLPKDITAEEISIDVNIDYSSLVAPIEGGTALGTASVVVNGTVYSTVKLVTASGIEIDKKAHFKARMEEALSAPWIKTTVIIVLAALLIYAVLMVRYKAVKRRHLRERMEAAERRKRERERAENFEKSRRAQEEMRRYRETHTEDEASSAPRPRTRVPIERADPSGRYQTLDPSARDVQSRDVRDVARDLGRNSINR